MLDILRRIIQDINATRTLNEALSVIVIEVKAALHTDVCSVYMTDPVRGEHVLMATDGLRPGAVGKVRLKLGQGLIGLAASRAEPVNVDNAPAHPAFRYIPATGEAPFHGFVVTCGITFTFGGLKIDDEAFWVSGTFGKVTLGETKGAIDWAVPDVYSGTAISDDHSTHAGAYWNTGLDGQYDDQILRYEYSFGDFGVALSAEMDDTGVQDTIWGLGGKWSGQLSGLDVSAGLGYQSNGGADTVSVGASASMSNGLSFALGYASFNSDDGADGVLGTVDDGLVFNTGNYVSGNVLVDNWMGVGIAYTTGALTVGANYSVYSAALAGVQDPSGWGLVANYDLGGGAVAMAGYGASDNGVSGNGHGDETWSIGLGLSF